MNAFSTDDDTEELKKNIHSVHLKIDSNDHEIQTEFNNSMIKKLSEPTVDKNVSESSESNIQSVKEVITHDADEENNLVDASTNYTEPVFKDENVNETSSQKDIEKDILTFTPIKYSLSPVITSMHKRDIPFHKLHSTPIPCHSSSLFQRKTHHSQDKPHTLSVTEISDISDTENPLEKTFEELLEEVTLLCEEHTAQNGEMGNMFHHDTESIADEQISKINLEQLFSSSPVLKVKDKAILEEGVHLPLSQVSDPNYFSDNRKMKTYLSKSSNSGRFKNIDKSVHVYDETVVDDLELVSEDILGLDSFVSSSDDENDYFENTVVHAAKSDSILRQTGQKVSDTSFTVPHVSLNDSKTSFTESKTSSVVEKPQTEYETEISENKLTISGEQYKTPADKHLIPASGSLKCASQTSFSESLGNIVSVSPDITDTESAVTDNKTEEAKMQTILKSPVPKSILNGRSDLHILKTVTSDKSTTVTQPPENQTKGESTNIQCTLAAEAQNLLQETELTLFVKKKWKISAIQRPDINLTKCIHLHKTKGNINRGLLEGDDKIPPLIRTVNNYTSSTMDIPHVKRRRVEGIQKDKVGQTAQNLLSSLREQLRETDEEWKHKQNFLRMENIRQLSEMRYRHSVMTRSLHVKQQQELQSMKQRFMYNPFLLQYKYMKLCEEHMYQNCHLHKMKTEEMENISKELCHKTKNEHDHYKSLSDQIKHMITTFENDVANVNTKESLYIAVNLWKGPCKTNNQKKSLVKVCLPAETASNIMREDGIYDLFYSY